MTPNIYEIDKRLSSHEEVCAERYDGLKHRIGRLEAIIIGANGSVIVALVIAVWWFVTHGVK